MHAVNNLSKSTSQGLDIPDSEYVCPDGNIFQKATKETVSFSAYSWDAVVFGFLCGIIAPVV